MKCINRIPHIKGSSKGYKWIPSTVYDGLPPLALSVGHESDGTPIYLGRADHIGCTYPVKIIPEKQSAYITYNGGNLFVRHFEILCGSGFRWIRSGKGHVPSNAVSYHKSENNSFFYIGRAHHGNGLIPGKIHPSKGCLFISAPDEGETSYMFYDVLIHDQAKNEVEIKRGQWIHAVSNGPVPAGAVRAGHDSDGTVIYVGRVNHEGNMIPAKIIPQKKMAHTQHGGQEIGKPDYEALCNVQVAWIPFQGRIPEDSVSCGKLANGEQVFIGRGRYMGSLTPGKVLQNSRKLYIPFGWNEVEIDKFEILVYDNDGDFCCLADDIDDHMSDDCCSRWEEEDLCNPDSRKNLTWIPSKNNQNPPEGAVLAGYDSDRSPIYVGRVMLEGNQLPAKVIPRKQLCHTQHNGEEIEMISYEALCHGNVSWVRFRGTIPPNALECGRLNSGEAVFIGRGRHLGSLTPGKVLSSDKVLYIPFGWKEIRITDFEILVNNSSKICNKKLKWLHTKRERPAPPGAILAGKNSNGSPIYVGRVQHDGNRFVAKVIPEEQICDTADESGQVISKLSYEALSDAQVKWVLFQGVIPAEAIECGRDRHGGKTFIGRCHHQSELVPGTVLEAEKKLRFVAGTEMKLETNFEILVHSCDHCDL